MLSTASTPIINTHLGRPISATDLYDELKNTKSTLYKAEQCKHNVAKFYHHLQAKYLHSSLENNLFVIYWHNGNNGAMPYGKSSFAYHTALIYFDSEKSDWYYLDYDALTTLKCEVSQPVTAKDAVQKMFAESGYLQRCLDEAINQYPKPCYGTYSVNQMMLFSLPEWDKIKDSKHLPQDIAQIEGQKPFFPLEESQLQTLNEMRSDGLSFINLYQFLEFIKKAQNKTVNSPAVRLQPIRNIIPPSYTSEEDSYRLYANHPLRMTKEQMEFVKNFIFTHSPLYELISGQLTELNLRVEALQRADIVEYMLLEQAECLSALQGAPLKCAFIPGHTGGLRNEDLQPLPDCSGIQLSLHEGADEATQLRLKYATQKFRYRFKDALSDSSYNRQIEHGCGFILPDKTIETAIRSSSLFRAAGDLSNLKLKDLLELKENLAFYKLRDPHLFEIVDKLTTKVSLFIEHHFTSEQIRKASPEVSKALKAKQTIVAYEKRFNDQLTQLQHQISWLKQRAQKTVWNKGFVPNPDWDPEYEQPANAADQLTSALQEAQKEFFSQSPTEQSIIQFQRACSQAVSNAKPAFAQHRSWWGQLHPGIKILLGIAAAMTLVPAGIIHAKSKDGFWETCFRGRTHSEVVLDTFKKTTCAVIKLGNA